MSREETYTYDELKHQGFIVRHGERRVGRNRYGEAVFTIAQCDEDPYHNDPSVGKGQAHA